MVNSAEQQQWKADFDKMKSKVPNPCIDVCKYKRRGHCIGCAMTKAQKSLFKTIKKDKHREAFVHMLLQQQEAMGKYKGWRGAYAKKCSKRGVRFPFLLRP